MQKKFLNSQKKKKKIWKDFKTLQDYCKNPKNA